MAINVQNPVRYAIPRWLDQDHPRVEPGHCIAQRRAHNSCTICADICPTGATLSHADHTWESCIDCNLCASACPTRALRGSADNIGDFLHIIQGKAEQATFGCEAAEGDAYLTMYCLGGIPWEVIALTALDHKAVLDISHCKGCPEKAGRKLLLENLERVAKFLGKKRFLSQVIVEGSSLSTNGVVGGVSRRDAFSSILENGSTVFDNLTNAQVKKPIEGKLFRNALRMRLENPAPTDPKRYGLMAVSFTDNCWSCTTCKNACPTHAITVRHEVADSEYYMVVDPLLCIGCGVCKDVCKDEGIDEVFEFRTETPLVSLATLAHPTVCEKCGRNFRPNGETKCLYCRRAEEREARKAEQ